MTAPDTFAMLTLRGKVEREFMPADERFVWGVNAEIPISLRRDTDRDDGHKGEG